MPIVPRGTPADELDACLKASFIWQHVKVLTLRTNIRVHLHGDQTAGDLSNLLLRIGNGEIPSAADGQIVIPSACGQIVQSLDNLKESVYPNITENFNKPEWLCQRAILAPLNDAVNAINDRILQEIPGPEKTYKSVDSTLDRDHAIQFPTEFLNSVELPGMPPHNMRLKVGCPVMLLRNLDAPRLCHGTRLIIKTLHPHVTEATILTGCAEGETTFIP